jgi:hypothetical protein
VGLGEQRRKNFGASINFSSKILKFLFSNFRQFCSYCGLSAASDAILPIASERRSLIGRRPASFFVSLGRRLEKLGALPSPPSPLPIAAALAPRTTKVERRVECSDDLNGFSLFEKEMF